MFIGYYPFAKERTKEAFLDYKKLLTCQPNSDLTKVNDLSYCKQYWRKWAGVALDVVAVVAQVALVAENPIVLLRPDAEINLAFAIFSAVGLNPPAYATIMRILKKTERDKRSSKEKYADYFFGVAWSFFCAYTTLSSTCRLVEITGYGQ